ncbi:MAG: hypothetical protein IPH75_09900 [bacterium]|nr:hypothetical protein [bacterium]
MYRSRVFLCLAILLLAIPGAVFAQGEYLWGSNSGWQLGAGIAGGNEVTNYYGALGTSIKGIADLAVYYGRQDKSGWNKGVGGVQLSFWLLKEGRRGNPLSLGLSGSFEGTSGHGISTVSVGLAKRINIPESKTFLLPSLSLGSVWGIEKGGYYYSESDRLYSLSLGLGLAIPLHPRSCLVFSVGHTAVEDASATGGMVSIVFGRFGKE